jgi:hypothetical protein
MIERFVRRIRAHGERRAVSRRRADERRAPHLHGLDRACGILDRFKRHRFESVRQLRLVDDLDRAVLTRPDGAVVLAFDLHARLVAKGRAY